MYAVAVARILVWLLSISLAGIPPFTGFYLKILVLAPLAELQLWFVSLAVVVGTCVSFVFYGRLVVRNWFLFTSEYYRRSNAGGVRSVIGAYITTTPHVVLLPVLLVVAALVFIFSFVFIAGVTQTLSFLAARFLSPVFRSTEHRSGFIMSAMVLGVEERPNNQLFSSWGSLYWFLPLWHFLGWGERRIGVKYMPTGIHEPLLLPRFDSRYFWIGEWLMYPWWTSGHIHLDRREIGAVFEEYFRPWESEILGWLYRLTSSTGSRPRYDSDFDERTELLIAYFLRGYHGANNFKDFGVNVEFRLDEAGTGPINKRFIYRLEPGHHAYWTRVLANMDSVMTY